MEDHIVMISIIVKKVLGSLKKNDLISNSHVIIIIPHPLYRQTNFFIENSIEAGLVGNPPCHIHCTHKNIKQLF